MNLLDDLIVFFLERRMRGVGIQFATPRGAREALLEQAMAFELPRDEHDVQICLFVVFDMESGDEETVRMRYDFPLGKEEFSTHPFFDVIDGSLIFYRLRGSDQEVLIENWKEDLPSAQRAWVLAVDGLKDKRGVPLVAPSRRRNLKSGWHRVARYETRVLFYEDERAAHQVDAGHPRVAEEPSGD